MTCESERCLILGFKRCRRRARYEVRGPHSMVRLCEQCRREHAAEVDRTWSDVVYRVRLINRGTVAAVAWIAFSFGLGLVLGGCGTVDQAAQLDASGAAAAAGGAGAGPAGSGGRGAAGAAGDGSPAGGAAGGGQGGAMPLGADAGGAAGREVDAGAAWPTCPRVGGLVIEYATHCWSCEAESDAGTISGIITGPCQIDPASAKGLGLNQGPDYCAAKAAACP